MSRLLKWCGQNIQEAGWSVSTFLFKIPLYVHPRGNEPTNVGRKAQAEDLGCTQEKSGCRLLRLRIKIDAALPAQEPWDCIFPAAYVE